MTTAETPPPPDGGNRATLLPPNATPQESALERATLRMTDLPLPHRDLWSPQRCPPALLPWLAWSVGIDSWDPDWPEAIKRSRIAAAITIQRRKGSVQSVRDVIASFGGQVAMREWWQQNPPGPPYTFTLTVAADAVPGVTDSARYADSIIREVERTMPARCRFTFVQSLSARGAARRVAIVRPHVTRRLALVA